MGSMKTFAVLAVLSCTLCAPAQTTYRKKSSASVPVQSRLSDEFAKDGLRAVLAMDPDNGSTDDLISQLVNEASVDAQTPDELQAVKDLRTLVDIRMVNLSIKHLAFASAQLRWVQNNEVGDLDKMYRSDPAVPAAFKQDKDCQGSLEAVLRSRLYKPLPADCKLK
jgi:hypothetical protein